MAYIRARYVVCLLKYPDFIYLFFIQGSLVLRSLFHIHQALFKLQGAQKGQRKGQAGG